MQYIRANGTKIIFMVAVFSFLGVSIPHVAAVFRMYEPVAQGMNDVMWNTCSAAAAAGIDILAGWLTLVMMNKDARGRDKSIIWAFIIALMVFSWYCNWLFDMLHSPHPVNVWAITIINLPWLGAWTVDQLTPLVVSALPVFIVAYASIAHLVETKQVAAPLSLEELQQQAAEAQARAAAQVAIIKSQAQVREESINANKSTMKSVFAWGNKKEDDVVLKDGSPTDDTQPQIREQHTDKIPAISAENATPLADENQEQESPKAPAQNTPSKHSTGPLSVSVKEAALMLGFSESYVRELKNKGKLHSPPRNNKLLTTKSINEYQKTRQTQEQKEQKDEAKEPEKELALVG